MRFGGDATFAWRTLLLLSLFSITAFAAKDGPDISVKLTEHAPNGLNYFEDSDVILFHDLTERNIYRSDDAGKSWNRVKDIPEGEAAALVMHKFDSGSAFVLTESAKHYKTTNKGEKWPSFDSGCLPSAFQHELLVFHAGDPKRIIFNGMKCDGLFCDEESRYTTDGFDSIHLLRSFTGGCHWAKATPEFTTGDDDLDKTRTLCVVADPFSFFKEDQRLHVSDAFFEEKDGEIQEFEPNLDTNKGVSGVVNLATAKGYLLVATSAFLSDEMALFVTTDTINWHRAMFPSDDKHDHSHRITQEAYTVLESTNYSIQIDVMTSHPSSPMGVLFTSNSNGTYFTENLPYTNRNERGLVDFEKMHGIQGILLVNVVGNGKDVDENGDEKEVVSQISFDDGRTFSPLMAGDDKIHLHSYTQLDNIGRVFSSPAPGLVMGNGNTGKSLGPFKDADLYVSDDAGVTWKKALDGPHKYEFGDSGSILVAVKDSKEPDTDEFQYSLDHGENWKAEKLPDGLKIKAGLLTTTQDSTSLKFLLVGENKDGYHLIAIDFNGLHERTCKDKDMEDWHARVDDDGKPTCIMGHKQTYRRRKKDADCFINVDFKDLVPKIEDCECTDADFECDYNFMRDPDDSNVCKESGPMVVPDGACKGGSDDTYKGSSGWRLIPGNTCKRKKGEQKDDEVERKCSDSGSTSPPPASGNISHTDHSFETKLNDMRKFYLERGDSSAGSDETIIAQPIEMVGEDRFKVEETVWLSSDHGKSWEQILKGESVRGIHPHQFFTDVVYFTTNGEKVLYTVDRGHSFHTFEAPSAPPENVDGLLSFHPEKKDWLIWIGEICEKVGGSKSCFTGASISTDRGDHWKTMLRYATHCEFTGMSAYKVPGRPEKQVVCLAHKDESSDSPQTIMTSNDFFVDDKVVFDGVVVDFRTMSEFIVATKRGDEDGDLRPVASIDGKNFAEAHFPYNFEQGHSGKYTLLDSSTHAVNLFVLTEGTDGREYGSIVKSNSNGTSYVLSASHVNANNKPYSDFEKVAGIEGLITINTVSNYDKSKEDKKLQTKISHNDGSEWSFLPPPPKDVKGKSYKCSGNGDERCALHLHHYTERKDKGKTLDAATAIGLVFGVGNVGPFLTDMKDADTFMSTDGGVSWKNVKKGAWTWQYGDQGSILVLVERGTEDGKDIKTKTVSYSTDQGKTWNDYEFFNEEVTVLDLTTMRSGTSRNFVVWARASNGKVHAVNIDFSGLTDKVCEFKEDGDSDYTIWSPKHPLQDDDCMFGHVAQYLRKKPDRKCYNDLDLKRLYKYKHCACTRRDFECDFNYELDRNGQCSLVQGFKPITGQEWCERYNATSYFEPTGYRKVPLSTCKGGKEMDKTTTEHPCDGYEDDFHKERATSGIVIFFAVVIPFALAGAIGWYVYRNWSGKIGQIRLGDQGAAPTFDSEQPLVKIPVMAVSAVVAAVAALPVIVGSLFRSASGAYQRVSGGGRDRSWFSSGPRRFTTRDSFARGRGDYSVVDDVEGELLGEDSDEEV